MRRPAQFFGLVAVALVALAVGPPSTPQLQPLYRAGVDHVAVDVVVTDGHGQPVLGLSRDDFQLHEAGKPQSITDFEWVSIPVAHRTLDASSVRSAPTADVVTNVPPAPTSRAVVMVIDDLHIVESDIVPVQRLVTEFVRALSPNDEAAIVFVSRSDLSVDLTNDASRLLPVVDHVREALGFGEDALGATSPNGPSIRKAQWENARTADFVLQNVATSLAGSSFIRRAIVYVSAGSIVSFGPDPPPASDYIFLKDVYEAARRADVPIYPIDPRGLVQPEQAIRAGIGAIGGYGQPDGSGRRRLIAANIRNQQDRLLSNAEQTGGRAFVNRNDLPQAMDELIADNGAFYVLGYYPNPFVGDGKFHPIKVTVQRPGAHVRARAGYVASARVDLAETSGNGTNVPSASSRAFGAGVSVADIALRAAAAPVAPTAKGMATAVTVAMTYPSTGTASVRSDDDVELRALALDPDGAVLADTDRTFHLTGLPADLSGWTANVNALLDLPARHLTLRLGVTSRLVGKTGTVQVPVDMAKPTRAALQMPGVILGLADDKTPVLDPEALKDLVPFPPTTSRRFVTTDTIHVLAPVFWRGAASSATLTLSVPGSSMTPHTFTLTGRAESQDMWHATLVTELPLAGLSAGEYGLQIEGRVDGEQPVRRLIAFAIK